MLCNILLNRPKSALFVLFIALLICATQLDKFTFDASSDNLVVKGDPKLKIYADMASLFGGDEFVAMTYQPRNGDLFQPSVLADLAKLQAKINQVEGVAGTFSILDAPLLQNPPIPLSELSPASLKTLRSADVDLSLAKLELSGSPLFSNYLISSDGTSTAIRIDLHRETKLEALRRQRNQETANLAKINQEIRLERKAYVTRRQHLIDELETIRLEHPSARIYLTGVPMIAADMISYVHSDIINFGSIILLVVAALMWLFFRRVRWVVLPLLNISLSLYFTISLLGFLETPITVVSANFISLVAIICLSFSIHLIVRYRELLSLNPERPHFDLVQETMVSKFAPCLYTALTTILAFGSMTFSGIVPIEDFGWMMCAGIIISFLVSFSFFPAVLLILRKLPPSKSIGRVIFANELFNHLSQRHFVSVVIGAIVLAFVSVSGIQRISFENRFVDFFAESTRVHQGMKFVDQHLGGTLPFEVFLHFSPFEEETDEEDDFFTTTEEDYPERYWFDRYKLDKLASTQALLTDNPAVGKVISLSTFEEVARDLRPEKLSSVELAYLLGAIPESIRDEVIKPYARPESGLLRISGRVSESHPDYKPMQLVSELETVSEQQSDVTFTGVLVLFNDMLSQLAASQVQTMYYVIAATYIMFALLLRSMLLSLLALLPNILAASLVIAFMGFAGIPMDMMTITIAAICIGIGVDDAIHYLHRFREEYLKSHDIAISIERAHQTIGKAMYFTTAVIVAGFSVLVFSNFIPSVYFGLLTALAMVLALLANLTVLPSLLMLVYQRLGLSLLGASNTEPEPN